VVGNKLRFLCPYTGKGRLARLLQPLAIVGSVHPMKVSALVSTYKSERFFRGCLDDLTGQTLFRSHSLEVVVVVSGSPENEEGIAREYQSHFPDQITILVTEREPMYVAWNRAIEVAKGEYLTNANTDDRHRGDALEVIASFLDKHQGVQLAYGNCYVSKVENETFEMNPKTQTYLYPRFFAPNAALCYQFGPQPMWRKMIHREMGVFSVALRAAGDYDFNLRFAARFKAQRIDGPPTGTYLAHAGAISFKDDTIGNETERLYAQFRSPESIEAFYKAEGLKLDSRQQRSQALADFGVRAIQYYPPWFEGRPHSDIHLAHQFFTMALGLDPANESAANNLALCEVLLGNTERAMQVLAGLSERQAKENLIILKNNPDQIGNLSIIPSGLPFPSQHSLTFEGL